MLEKFSAEEREQLVSELKENGYTVKKPTNGIQKRTFIDWFEYENTYVHGKDIASAICLLCDCITDNFTANNFKRSHTTYRRNPAIPQDKVDEWKEICKQIKAIVEAHARPQLDKDKSPVWANRAAEGKD